MSTRAYSAAVEIARWRRTSRSQQRHPGVGQLTSQGVWRSRWARTIGTPRPRKAQRTMPEIPFVPVPNWGNSSQEHLPMHGDLRAAPPQIRDDRLADVARQRERSS